MALKNIKNNSGFTIVELLIVIVVIAILATISIVAYTGIQNRGKASASQSLASQAAKKAQTFYTVSSTANYPANVAAFAGESEARLEGLTLVDYSATAASAGDPATVANYSNGTTGIYRRLGATTGGCVYWWDYTKTTAQQTPLYFGSVTTGC